MIERFQAADGDGTEYLRAVAESRRRRVELDRGEPRVPLRPLVESRGREPSDGPRLSDGPNAERAGAQVHLARHAGGTDRRDAREQNEPQRQRHLLLRRLDHGAFE